MTLRSTQEDNLLSRVGAVTWKMEIYAKIYSLRTESILTEVNDINHIVWYLSIQRKRNDSSSEWFVVWTSTGNDFNWFKTYIISKLWYAYSPAIVSFRDYIYDGSSQKEKQKRLISVISLFSRLSRPKEAAFGFVDTALCVCFISGVFPCILEFRKQTLRLKSTFPNY